MVRLWGGSDLRACGSGATGATNAGRILGRRGFFIVLALDVFKGALAVALTIVLFSGAPLYYYVLCALAVVAGHVWPVFLQFRGGKGIGPFIGVWLAMGAVDLLLPLTLLAPVVVGVLFLPLRKGAFLAALCGLPAQPLLFWLLTGDALAALCGLVITVVILFAHRANFRNAFKPGAGL